MRKVARCCVVLASTLVVVSALAQKLSVDQREDKLPITVVVNFGYWRTTRHSNAKPSALQTVVDSYDRLVVLIIFDSMFLVR